MKPLSNVVITSNGIGPTSQVLVDGFPVTGVTAASFYVDAGGVTKACIDVSGVRTADYAPAAKAGTPIYDALREEFAANGR